MDFANSLSQRCTEEGKPFSSEKAITADYLLRAPLSNIRLAIDLLEDEIFPPALQFYVDVIVRNSKRMEEIIQGDCLPSIAMPLVTIPVMSV